MKNVLMSTAIVVAGLSMSACSDVTSWSKDTTSVPWSDELITNGDLALGVGLVAVAGSAYLWQQNKKLNGRRSEKAEFEYLQSTQCGIDRPVSPDFSDAWVGSETYTNGAIRHYYEDGYTCIAEYDYWDTEEAKRSQEIDECSMTHEQLVAFLEEYQFYGGDLDGMTPTQGAIFMHSLCDINN